MTLEKERPGGIHSSTEKCRSFASIGQFNQQG